DGRLGDRLNQAALGDEAGDQVGRGHVEGGVVDLHALGGGLAAQAVGDLARVALLDRDGVPARQIEVEGTARGGDVERDVVSAGQQRHPVGADLVGRVAVGRDAVG